MIVDPILSVILSALHQVISFGASLLRYWFIKKEVVCHCQNRVKGKVVIITGATVGIGYYIAVDLAKKGSILYLACRRREVGERTASDLRKLTGNQNINYLYLDLTKVSTIRDFVGLFQKREKRLDILVNNAGVFHHPSYLTDDGFEITYQTNYLGVFLLTSLLRDVIPKTSSSRILFLSSEAHRVVSTKVLNEFDCKKPAETKSFMDYVNLYAVSKLAVQIYADHLSKTVPEALIVAINPGNVWSNIYRNCWLSWRDLLTRINCALFMRHPEEGAQSSIHALNAPGNINGKYITDTLERESLIDYSEEVSNSLIRKSEELLDL